MDRKIKTKEEKQVGFKRKDPQTFFCVKPPRGKVGVEDIALRVRGK